MPRFRLTKGSKSDSENEAGLIDVWATPTERSGPGAAGKNKQSKPHHRHASAHGSAAAAARGGIADVTLYRSIENGAYGFNLRGRGSTTSAGATIQRGQYVRSVDFGGPAHSAGLRSGDRIVAVDGDECSDEAHESVLARIAAAGSPLRLRVVRCSATAEKAKRVTESLIGERHRVVMNQRTNVPHLTVEMLDEPLGRTKMLQQKVFAGDTPVYGAGGKENAQPRIPLGGPPRPPTGRS